MQQGRDFISSHPIMLIAPASVIAITILIFNLTGDALRDSCLLYTSDAADDTPCVDLGGRRIIKKLLFVIKCLSLIHI
ncbi:hypothetical protein JMUB7554_27840 [Staphylococcus aureus]